MIKCTPDNVVNVKPRLFRTRISRIKNYDRRIRILHRKFVMDFHQTVQEKAQEDLNTLLKQDKNDDTDNQETK